MQRAHAVEMAEAARLSEDRAKAAADREAACRAESNQMALNARKTKAPVAAHDTSHRSEADMLAQEAAAAFVAARAAEQRALTAKVADEHASKALAAAIGMAQQDDAAKKLAAEQSATASKPIIADAVFAQALADSWSLLSTSKDVSGLAECVKRLILPAVRAHQPPAAPHLETY